MLPVYRYVLSLAWILSRGRDLLAPSLGANPAHWRSASRAPRTDLAGYLAAILGSGVAWHRD